MKRISILAIILYLVFTYNLKAADHTILNIKDDDFVGADMAKKYLHMGFTRARRYYNHSSGKKWTKEESICHYSGLPSTKSYEWKVLPYDRTEKRFLESSNIFKTYWEAARTDEKYLEMKNKFKKNKKKT